MDLSLDDRRIAHRGERRYEILHGRVEGLIGNQHVPLISRVRFDLGVASVTLHGLLQLPPRLEDGDDVVVAGSWRRGGFEAWACARLGESSDEFAERVKARRRRRSLWIGLAVVALVTPLLWALLSDSDRWVLWWGAFVAVGPISAIVATCEAYSRAELELELAIALGREGQPEGSSSNRNSSRTHSSLSRSDASSSASRLDG